MKKGPAVPKESPKTYQLIKQILRLQAEQPNKRKKILAEINQLLDQDPLSFINGRLREPRYFINKAQTLVCYNTIQEAVYIIDDPELLTDLMAKGLDPDLPTYDQAPGLHCAIRTFASKCALKLIEKGFSCWDKDPRGHAPLFLAASHDMTEVVQVLCEKSKQMSNGPELINETGPDGGTALAIAIQCGNPVNTRVLHEASASYLTAGAIFDPFQNAIVHAIRNENNRNRPQTTMASVISTTSGNSLEEYLQTIRYLFQLNLASPLKFTVNHTITSSIFSAFLIFDEFKQLARGKQLKMINLFLAAGAGLVITPDLKAWNVFYKIPDAAAFFIIGFSKTDNSLVKIFTLEDFDKNLADPNIDIDYQSLWHTLNRFTDEQLPCRSELKLRILQHYPKLDQTSTASDDAQAEMSVKKTTPLTKEDIPTFNGTVDLTTMSNLIGLLPHRDAISGTGKKYIYHLMSKSKDPKQLEMLHVMFVNIFMPYLKYICQIGQQMVVIKDVNFRSIFNQELEEFCNITGIASHLLFKLYEDHYDEYADEIESSLFIAYKIIERYYRQLDPNSELAQDISEKLALSYATQAEKAFSNGDITYATHCTQMAHDIHSKTSSTKSVLFTYEDIGRVRLLESLLRSYINLKWDAQVPAIITTLHPAIIADNVTLLDRYLSRIVANVDLITATQQVRELIAKFSEDEAPKPLPNILSVVGDPKVATQFMQSFMSGIPCPEILTARLAAIEQLRQQHRQAILDTADAFRGEYFVNDECITISQRYAKSLIRWLNLNQVSYTRVEEDHRLQISMTDLCNLSTKYLNIFLQRLTTLRVILPTVQAQPSSASAEKDPEYEQALSLLFTKHNSLSFSNKAPKSFKSSVANFQDSDSDDEDNVWVDPRDEIETLLRAHQPEGFSDPIMIVSPHDHTRDHIFFCSVDNSLVDDYAGALHKREDSKHRFSADSIPYNGVGEHGIKIGCKTNAAGKKEFHANLKHSGAFRGSSYQCHEIEYQDRTVYYFLIADEAPKDRLKRKY